MASQIRKDYMPERTVPPFHASYPMHQPPPSQPPVLLRGSPLFTRLKDSYVTLINGGVYRQAALYERHGTVYAAYGSGYIKIRIGGATSAASQWCDIILEEYELKINNLGFYEIP